jgi:oligopeptide/dipeptide ABC transporter ATP-binding protein
MNLESHTLARDTDDPILRIQGLTTEFATGRGVVHALDGVSFDVPRASAVGLVGESGSGKTTVALAILRLLGPGGRVRGGKILFQQADILKASVNELRQLRGNRVAVVFQDPLTSLTPSLRVGEQIAETILAHKKISRGAAWDRARDLLALVGVPDPAARSRQYPHHLSGGMRQRVSIAIALACDPQLLILDEPTTALDVTIQAQILELLDRLRREMRLSMLFITHDLGVIAQICDSVCVLYGGHLLERAGVADLFRQPLHPYTKGLLACVPSLGASSLTRRLPHIAGRVPDLVDPPPGCVFEPRCPFAEPRCRTEPQPLRPASTGAAVACWKFEALWEERWPVTATARAPTTAATGPALTTVRLSKEYALSGFWGSLRAGRDTGLIPRIWYEPRKVGAIDNVSLTIEPGETLGLVGESGCGKSTLARALVGLILPTSGEIHLDGQHLHSASREAWRRYRKDVQIVFQDPESSLNPRKTVAEILARPLVLYGLTGGGRLTARVAELLEAVQLSPTYGARYPYQLSGGEKQRVGIARALAAQPRFIVCDEAVSSLDVSVRASILNLLDDLKGQFSLAYLFIAHDLAVVKHISNRIAVMYRGRVCELGSVAEIFSPPYHPYTWALLSAIPAVEYRTQKRNRVALTGSVASMPPGRPGCVFADRCPVKIGPICDSTTPPNIQVSPGHWIACHHPVSVLETLDPVLATVTDGVAG